MKTLVQNPRFIPLAPLTGEASTACKAMTFAGNGTLGGMSRDCMSQRHNGVYTQGKGRSHTRVRLGKRERHAKREALQARVTANARTIRAKHTGTPEVTSRETFRAQIGF